jgi:plastocyanin
MRIFTVRRFGLRLVVALAGLTALGVLAAGCGSTNSSDPTPVKTFKITPASGDQATATAVPVVSATATSDGGTGGATTLTIVGQDVKFDKDELSARAGEVTIEFDNKDSGVPHNIHFHKGPKVSDASLEATDLESGPVEQTLTLTLEAGEYYYQCDAHPATMKGVLTVE